MKMGIREKQEWIDTKLQEIERICREQSEVGIGLSENIKTEIRKELSDLFRRSRYAEAQERVTDWKQRLLPQQQVMNTSVAVATAEPKANPPKPVFVPKRTQAPEISEDEREELLNKGQNVIGAHKMTLTAQEKKFEDEIYHGSKYPRGTKEYSIIQHARIKLLLPLLHEKDAGTLD